MKRLYTALVVLFVFVSFFFYKFLQSKSLGDTAYTLVSQF